MRARVPIGFASFLVALQDPADPDAGEAESFREITKNGGIEILPRGGRRRPAINRVVDLVDDELHLALLCESAQCFQVVRAYGRTCRVVG